jgi:hypothetical protein
MGFAGCGEGASEDGGRRFMHPPAGRTATLGSTTLAKRPSTTTEAEPLRANRGCLPASASGKAGPRGGADQALWSTP